MEMMRGHRTLTAGILVVLVVFGWIFYLFNWGISDREDRITQSYRQALNLAEDYAERRLWQKSILEYDAAIELRNREEDRAAQLTVYQQAYEENPSSFYEGYLEAARQAAKTFPKNASFCLTTADLAIQNENYALAYRTLRQSIDAKCKDENVLKQYQEVQYHYTLKGGTYSEIQSFSNGIYSVCDGTLWGGVDADGSDTVAFEYQMLGPVGADGVYVCARDDTSGLIGDLNGILQGRLPFSPTAASAYSEGLVAVCDGKNYSYYDLLGDQQFGSYESAGAFQNGVAAVETKDGWALVNTKGEVVSKRTYEAIVLDADGTYLTNGVMIAKIDGVYQLYDDKEQVVGNFSCDDVDGIKEDGIFAFCSDQKWGFADTDGNVLIEPSYKDAKSFSNGFGAVLIGNTWGFINIDGTLVIDDIFLNVDYFNDQGKCLVELGPGNWQFIEMTIWEG